MADQKPGKLGRVLSYASNKSKKSATQGQSQSQNQYGHARKKTDSSDTTSDRPSSRKMRTHADPTLAMSEAQPCQLYTLPFDL